jgi:hypothetical protein
LLISAVLAQPAWAQAVDLTLFAGRAFPVEEDRLLLQPGSPSIPGVDVDVLGAPELRTDGGSVFGGALALEFGIIAIEGRLDATAVGFDFTGAHYELTGVAPPVDGLTASLIADPGRFDADRISLLSINARLRTPGPVGIVVSGGLSYLPDITIAGSIPLTATTSGLSSPVIDADLVLRASPEEGDRWGVNGGVGLRIGGRVALVAEARVFYFKDYELSFGVENEPVILDDLLEAIPPVSFRPIFVNAQAGLVFRF